MTMKDRIHPNIRAMIDNMTEKQKEAISKKLSEPSEVMYEEIRQKLKDAFNPPHPEATISGWVARDKEICEQYNTDLWLGTSKPIRKLNTYWAASKAVLIPINSSLFPSLTWQDDPIEVEITIKPKKI